jgi:hypothetical protein
MNRSQAVLLALCMGTFTCSDVAALNKNAKLDSQPIALAADVKETKSETLGSSTAAKLCAKADYQCVNYAISISLLNEDGSTYKTKLPPPTPIIHGGTIHIYAGQTIYVEGDLSDDKLTNLRLVQIIKHPEKTIMMRLIQQTTAPAPANKGMIFSIHNPFDKNLKYHAVLMPLAEPGGAGTKTTTCPVKAKKTAAEVWQYPIVQLVLNGLKFINTDTDKDCIY